MLKYFMKCLRVVSEFVKWKIKNKIWHDKRSQKILRNKNKKRRHSSHKHGKKHNKVYICTAPKNFSIINNATECIGFFDDIIKKIDEHSFKAQFVIDTSNVETVTVDAIMYIIALLKDVRTKTSRALSYKFRGNYPKNPEARRVFVESGFTEYVNSNNKNIAPTTSRIHIMSGKTYNNAVAKEVCLFVQEHCNVTRKDTIPLYNTLIELMLNTHNHAYNDNHYDSSACEWYLYAEKIDNYVRFAFLDTGEGIPNTVYKKFVEKISLHKKDSDFIVSALNGDFRTQTRQNNRGKGLPQIKKCCTTGLLKDVCIFSGKGLCKINNETFDLTQNDYKTSFLGTLFSWNIAIKEENLNDLH